MSDATADGIGVRSAVLAVPELADRLRLAGALVAGKTFDAVSTVVVLSLHPTAYETQRLTRDLMGAYGPVAGVAISATIAIVAVVLLAECWTCIARWGPDGALPDWCPDGARRATYLVGASWFALVGVHNFLLLA